MNSENYIQTVKRIRNDILRSRYNIAKIANKEILFLYFNIGNVISEKVSNEKWGSKTIEKLSADLQLGLNGLRGFSPTNLKRMQRFYDEWQHYMFEIVNKNNEISPSVTDQFADHFLSLSFTAHYEIISKIKNADARLYYISKSAQEFWSVRNLKHQLANKLFEKKSQFPNNFDLTIQSENKEKALASFRDQYLFDFLRISDEEQDDEKVLENEIVLNIKKFLMSLGNDFAFIGNQYRIIVEGDEYFIDLLFFNRRLQALVAFELKSGKFKPEYLGKMNFYLSALDEYVKQEHEKPSIGIILCKEKKNKIVEFSFRDFDKAMGVVTYSTSNTLPEKYKDILPSAKSLMDLM